MTVKSSRQRVLVLGEEAILVECLGFLPADRFELGFAVGAAAARGVLQDWQPRLVIASVQGPPTEGSAPPPAERSDEGPLLPLPVAAEISSSDQARIPWIGVVEGAVQAEAEHWLGARQGGSGIQRLVSGRGEALRNAVLEQLGERRRLPRAPVTVRVRVADPDQTVDAETCEMGRGMIAVRVEQPWPVDAVLQLGFTDGQLPRDPLTVTVVRVDRPVGLERPRMTLRLSGVSESAAPWIEQLARAAVLGDHLERLAGRRLLLPTIETAAPDELVAAMEKLVAGELRQGAFVRQESPVRKRGATPPPQRPVTGMGTRPPMGAPGATPAAGAPALRPPGRQTASASVPTPMPGATSSAPPAGASSAAQASPASPGSAGPPAGDRPVAGAAAAGGASASSAATASGKGAFLLPPTRVTSLVELAPAVEAKVVTGSQPVPAARPGAVAAQDVARSETLPVGHNGESAGPRPPPRAGQTRSERPGRERTGAVASGDTPATASPPVEPELEAPEAGARAGRAPDLTDPWIGGRFRLRGLPRVTLGHHVIDAWHVVLDYPVTLIFLPPAQAGQLAAVNAFHGAGRAAAQVRHPGLVHVVDTAEDNSGALYLVLDGVMGTSLRELLSQGAMAAHRVRGALLGVAQALVALHAAGTPHGQLSPDHIFVDDEGVGRLWPASLVPASSSPDGRYQAPEVQRGEPADPQSDLCSLGVVLLEILSGEPPRPAVAPRTGTVPGAALVPSLPEDHWRMPAVPLDRALWQTGCRAAQPSRRSRTASAAAFLSELMAATQVLEEDIDPATGDIATSSVDMDTSMTELGRAARSPGGRPARSGPAAGAPFELGRRASVELDPDLRAYRSPVDEEAVTQPPRGTGSVDIALEITPPAQDLSRDLSGIMGGDDPEEDRGEPTQLARIPTEEPAAQGGTLVRRVELPPEVVQEPEPVTLALPALVPVVPAAPAPSGTSSRLLMAGGAFVVSLIVVVSLVFFIVRRLREPEGVVSQPLVAVDGGAAAGAEPVPAVPGGGPGAAPAGPGTGAAATGTGSSAAAPAGTAAPAAPGTPPAAPDQAPAAADTGPERGPAVPAAAPAAPAGAPAEGAPAAAAAAAAATDAPAAEVKPATTGTGRKARGQKRRRRR